MVVLPSLSPHGCLPWLLAMGLLFCALRTARVLDTVQTRPVHGDPEQMTRYCREIAGKDLPSDQQERFKWQGVMIREGAHSHAMRAMKDFPEERGLHLACMDALGAVARHNYWATLRLWEDGAGRALMSTGLGFFFDPEVTGNAAGTLASLAMHGHHLRQQLLVLGGAQFASDTLVRYPDNPSTIVSACQMAMTHMLGMDFIILHFKEDHDFVRRMLDLLRKFPRAEDGVRVVALQVLNGMAGGSRPSSEQMLGAMVEEGVVEALAAVKREEQGDFMQRYWSNRLVDALMGQPSRDWTAQALGAGLAPLLASSLDHAFDERQGHATAESDAWALQALERMLAADSQQSMLKAGVAETIESAMRRRPSSKDLLGRGPKIIEGVRGGAGKAS